MAAKDFLLDVVYCCNEYCGYILESNQLCETKLCFRMILLGIVENSHVVLMRDPRLAHLKLTHQSS